MSALSWCISSSIWCGPCSASRGAQASGLAGGRRVRLFRWACCCATSASPCCPLMESVIPLENFRTLADQKRAGQDLLRQQPDRLHHEPKTVKPLLKKRGDFPSFFYFYSTTSSLSPEVRHERIFGPPTTTAPGSPVPSERLRRLRRAEGRRSHGGAAGMLPAGLFQNRTGALSQGKRSAAPAGSQRHRPADFHRPSGRAARRAGHAVHAQCAGHSSQCADEPRPLSGFIGSAGRTAAGRLPSGGDLFLALSMDGLSGAEGARAMADYLQKLNIKPCFVLDYGGYATTESFRSYLPANVPLALIGVAEKGLLMGQVEAEHVAPGDDPAARLSDRAAHG